MGLAQIDRRDAVDVLVLVPRRSALPAADRAEADEVCAIDRLDQGRDVGRPVLEHLRRVNGADRASRLAFTSTSFMSCQARTVGLNR